MPQHDMSDLVCHDAGELGFVVRVLENASIDIQKAAWQSERIDLLVVDDLN